MSISPEKREEFGLSKVERARQVVTKVVGTYFKNPLHYLFYGMLTLTIVGLFFGMRLQMAYYAILILLTGTKIFLHFYGKWNNDKDVRAVQEADSGGEGAV